MNCIYKFRKKKDQETELLKENMWVSNSKNKERDHSNGSKVPKQQLSLDSLPQLPPFAVCISLCWV